MSDGNDSPKTLALEELKLVQAIIGHLEEKENKVYTWYLTINVALIVAVLSEEKFVSPLSYQYLSLLLLVFFLFLTLIIRAGKHHAVAKALEIEEALNNGSYTACSVVSTLRYIPSPYALLQAFWRWPFVVIVLGLIFQILFVTDLASTPTCQ